MQPLRWLQCPEPKSQATKGIPADHSCACAAASSPCGHWVLLAGPAVPSLVILCSVPWGCWTVPRPWHSFPVFSLTTPRLHYTSVVFHFILGGRTVIFHLSWTLNTSTVCMSQQVPFSSTLVLFFVTPIFITALDLVIFLSVHHLLLPCQ